MLIQQFIGLLGPGEGKLVADKLCRFTFPNHFPGHVDPSFFRPTPGKFRRQGTDLAADQLNAVAMKPSPQIQLGLLGAVPGAEHDTAAETGNLDGLVQGLRVARQLIH